VIGLLALLAGCGGDPALDPFAASLKAWDEGRAALADGRPADAVTAFAAAREKDPGSVPLRLWEAKALADAGRLADADERLTEIVTASPDVGMAWYNRAAYRVRSGRLPDAAADLARALALHARSPLEAADDPDFASARSDPAFAGVLPAQPIEANIRGAEGSVFVGSRYPLEITAATLPTAALDLTRSGADPGCLTLVRIVQDDHPGTGLTDHAWTLDLRADAACVGTLGPFTLRAGSASAELAPVAVQVEAPPAAAPVTLAALPTQLPIPSALAPADAGATGARFADGVVAMGRPDAPITGNDRKPDVALEWRVEGQTRAAGGWWRESGPVTLRAGEWTLEVR
jgi:hypothetical protein